MPDTKISALTAATFLDGAEELPLAQAGANEKATVSQVIGGAYCVLQADYTLANSASQQKLFNTTTNGALTLTTGTYNFEAAFAITGMSGTSGNAAFSIQGAGTATLAKIFQNSVGRDILPLTTASAAGGNLTQAAAFSTNTTTAGTSTAMTALVFGVFDVTASGTIIPSVALTTAIGTAVVLTGSYIRVQRIGPTATATLGNWS